MPKVLKLILIVFAVIFTVLLLLIYGGSFIGSKILTNYVKKNVFSGENIKFRDILIVPYPLSCNVTKFEVRQEGLTVLADSMNISSTYGSLYGIYKGNNLDNIGASFKNLSVSVPGSGVGLSVKKSVIKYRGKFTLDWLSDFDFYKFIKENQNVYIELQDLSLKDIEKLFKDADIKKKIIDEYINIIKLLTTFKLIKINSGYDGKKSVVNIRNFSVKSDNLNGGGKFRILLNEKDHSVEDMDGKADIHFTSDKKIDFPLTESGKYLGFRNFTLSVSSGGRGKIEGSEGKSILSFAFEDFYYDFDEYDFSDIFLAGYFKDIKRITADNYTYNIIFDDGIFDTVMDFRSKDFFDFYYRDSEKDQGDSVFKKYIKITNFNKNYEPVRKNIINALRTGYGLSINNNEDIDIFIEEKDFKIIKVVKNVN